MTEAQAILELRRAAPPVFSARLNAGTVRILGTVPVNHPRFKTAIIARCVDYPGRRRVSYFVMRKILDASNRHVQVVQRIFQCPWTDITPFGYNPEYLFKLQRVQCNVTASQRSQRLNRPSPISQNDGM